MSSYQKEREQLIEILSKREYQIYYEDNRSFVEKSWDAIREWLADILSKVFESFDPSTTVGNSIITVVLIVILLAVAIGIVAIIMTVTRRKRLKNHQPFASSNQLQWGYQEHLNVAKQYASEEEYRLATRHQFLAFLLLLNDKSLLTAKLWKTNWDYYDELKQTEHALAQDFYQLALFFDRSTYGEQQITAEDYQQYQAKILDWINSIAQNHPFDKEIGER
ncbi:DUF4129 domain-containing protein [Gracilibacillus kekensis]|uniref:Protein-glutamine gamma-glutamyltransferase-like C-terminal domain-containing protein n=1 Tax=Gracilibacillus kekensis TaxID=1027249 RepID=A0A1M7QJC4_9BACI|nr:DUF4129 domain-containing protein [Gracilibacillus kekensis]SHN31196.1 protein of unknown function [Gracilibacillus kekensis]